VVAQFSPFWSTHIDALERPSIAWINNTKEVEDTAPKRERDKRREMKIKLTSVYVNDREPCLYYRSAGLREEGRLQPGPFRWLTWPHRRPAAPSCSWRSTATRRESLPTAMLSKSSPRHVLKTTCRPITSYEARRRRVLLRLSYLRAAGRTRCVLLAIVIVPL